jgi:hypothetical protein
MKKKQKSKNFLILGLFLFGVTLLLWNCTIEDNIVEPDNIDLSTVKTVSFKDAIAHFNVKKEKIKQKRSYAKSTKNTLNVTPDWNTLKHNKIAYTDANLTTANTKINRNGQFESQLYFIDVNNTIKNVIFTTFKKKSDINGNVMDAYVFFNEINGKFIDGYKIESGKFTKQLIIKKNIQQAGLFLFQSFEDADDSWCYPASARL